MRSVLFLDATKSHLSNNDARTVADAVIYHMAFPSNVVSVDGENRCMCRSCTDPPPRLEAEPMPSEEDLLKAIDCGNSFQVKRFTVVNMSGGEAMLGEVGMGRELIEAMARAMMPRPFHGPSGMAACVDIAQGGTEYLKYADPNGGPMMRALARWADWFGVDVLILLR